MLAHLPNITLESVADTVDYILYYMLSWKSVPLVATTHTYTI